MLFVTDTTVTIKLFVCKQISKTFKFYFNYEKEKRKLSY